MQQISLDEWIESNARREPIKEKRKPKKKKRAPKGVFIGRLPRQSSPFVVYGIRCPRTNALVYVGATQDLVKRAQKHYYQKSRGFAVSAWIQEIRSSGMFPRFEILGGYDTETSAGIAELDLIRLLEPIYNSKSPAFYAGPCLVRQESIAFPNGLVVDQGADSPRSNKCDPMPSDSLAVRKIKLAIGRSGIRITTIALVTGATYQSIGLTLIGKTRPRLPLALKLSELFCFPIEDWTTHHFVASQEVAA